MDELWNTTNYGCKLDYSNITSLNFTSNWILQEVLAEQIRVKQDLELLRLEVSSLYPSSVTDHRAHSRHARAVPFAIMAGAGAGIFGLGLGLKDKLSCTLGRIFGGCNELAKQNRKAIKESIGYINLMPNLIIQ